MQIDNLQPKLVGKTIAAEELWEVLHNTIYKVEKFLLPNFSHRLPTHAENTGSIL